MKKTLWLGMMFAATLLVCSACGTKTENGLKYKILEKGKGRAAQMSDIIEGTLTLSSGDSVLFALDKSEKIFQISESIYPGDLNEGFLKLHEGDSAVFYVPVDSLVKYMGGGMPDFVTDYMVYAIKVNKLYTEEELQQEEMLAMAEARQNETPAIEKYLADHNLKAQPDENGLYFIQTKKGTGKVVEQGQEVSVNYVGKRLDGKIFDTNLEDVAMANDMFMPGRTYEPMTFRAGVGQMIPGFDMAVLKMNKGSKATVIIPFDLAYGPRPVSEDLPAFTTLVFEIELVDIR